MSDQDFILVDEDDKEKDTENQTPVTGDEEKQEIAASGKKDREEEKEDGYEKICFICHRPESVTGRMIELHHMSGLYAEEL